MKKIALALALTLAGGTAFADTGFYLGGGVSQVQLDGFENNFSAGDLDDFEIDETAWKLIAGIRPLPFLAVEANYMDLGESDAVVGPDRFTADAKAISAFAIGFLPIPIVDVYGKLGLARWELDGSFDSALDRLDESGTDFAWGLGGQVKFGSLAARLEYEQFDVDNTDGVELLSLGLTYTFL